MSQKDTTWGNRWEYDIKMDPRERSCED